MKLVFTHFVLYIVDIKNSVVSFTRKAVEISEDRPNFVDVFINIKINI